MITKTERDVKLLKKAKRQFKKLSNSNNPKFLGIRKSVIKRIAETNLRNINQIGDRIVNKSLTFKTC